MLIVIFQEKRMQVLFKMTLAGLKSSWSRGIKTLNFNFSIVFLNFCTVQLFEFHEFNRFIVIRQFTMAMMNVKKNSFFCFISLPKLIALAKEIQFEP